MLTSHDEKEIDFSGTPIPKHIHYIWVGNQKGYIPENYLKEILKVSKIAQQSDFQVSLWVNHEKNIYKTFQKLDLSSAVLENHKSKIIAGIQIRNITELFSKMKEDSFFIENDRYKKLSYWINNEMVGFKNLAAAADLLRCIIMVLEGGYYTDTDNKLIFKKGQKFKEESLLPGIKVVVPLNMDGLRINPGGANNCFMASVPHHPLMEKVIDAALQLLKSFSETLTGKILPTTTKFELETKFETTILDLKRWPYSTTEFATRTNLNRRGFTIALGPSLLQHSFETFWIDYKYRYKENYEKLELMSAMFTPSGYIQQKNPIIGTVGGVECQMFSDQTWLKKPQKTTGFDDTQVLIERFFTAPKSLKVTKTASESTPQIDKKWSLS